MQTLLPEPDNLRVVAVPHPFREAREILYFKPGQSVAQLLKEIQPNPSLRRAANVLIDGIPIPQERWEVTIPKSPQLTMIRVIPASRGIAMIFVAIAAIVVGAFTAGLGIFATGALAGWGGVAGALASMAVGVVGMLLVNAIIPPPKQPSTTPLGRPGQPGQETPTQFVSGARNQLVKWGTIPCLLGHTRVVPQKIAEDYTEVQGDHQYVRCLFGQYGPIQVSNEKIGNTALGEYEGVEVERRNQVLVLEDQTIDINVSAKTLTRASGSWGRDGVKINDTLVLLGCTTSENDTSYLITAVTDLVLTYSTSSATTTESGTGSQTASITYGDDDLALYANNNDVHEDDSSILLEYNLPQVRTGEAGGRELSIDITFPNGLYSIDNNGNRLSKSVIFVIKCRKTGTSEWSVVSPDEIAGGDGARPPEPTATYQGGRTNYQGQAPTSPPVNYWTITASTSSAVRRGLRWAVNSDDSPTDTYDVQINRLTGADSTKEVSVSYWTAIRTIKYGAPVSYPATLMKTTVRIMASGQLNGTLDEYSFLGKSLYPDWDSATETWITRPTRNPASLVRAILQNQAAPDPMADARIYLPQFQYWHEYCETNGFTYSKNIDQVMNWWEMAQEVAAAGRASLCEYDGQYSVVLDELQEESKGHYNPRTVQLQEIEIAYPDLPHGFRCPFNNELNDYLADEMIVLDDAYQIDGLDAWGNPHPEYTPATKFEQLTLPGVTHPDQVFKLARYHIAVARLRYRKISFLTNRQNLGNTRGDKITLAHDVMLVGLAYGRVKTRHYEILGYDGDDPVYGPNVVGITMDETMFMEAGKSYGLVFRVPGETDFRRQIVTDAGNQTTVTFTDPIEPGETNMSVGDLVTFGEFESETISVIIKSIEHRSGLWAQVNCIDEAVGVHDADQGSIPEHDSGITIPAIWSKPVISEVRSDGTVLIRDPDGSWTSCILVSYSRLIGVGDLAGIEAQYWRDDSYIGPVYTVTNSLDDGNICLRPVEDGVKYAFQLRFIRLDGSRGPWCTAQTHTVEGKTAPPEDVTGFDVFQVKETIYFSWNPVPDKDVAGYELRYGAKGVAWDLATVITQTTLATGFTTPMIPPGNWDFLIKAIDSSGNYSEEEAVKSFKVVTFYQVLFDTNQYPLWAGTLTNMVRNPLTGHLNPEDQDDASANDFDLFDNYVVNPYAECSYEVEVDLTEDFTARSWSRIYDLLGPGETDSGDPTLYFDYKEDGGAYGGYAEWSIGVFLGRYAKFKVAMLAASGLRALTDFQPVVDKSL